VGCGRGLSQKKKKMTKMTTTTIEMADGKSLRTGSMIVNDWDGNDGEWKRRGKREKEGKNKKKKSRGR
jgi:hypothetical protein